MCKHPHLEPTHWRQRGAGLIEALVALLVLSFGMLAMARLSAASIDHQKSAQLRLVGVSLARLYGERARLNVYGFDLGHYDIVAGTAAASGTITLDPDAADDDAARDMAAADQQAFLTLVAATLPDGGAQVTSRPSAQARELDIWLLWRDTSADRDNSLDAAARHHCPANMNDSVRDGRRCMHFRVGL